MRRIVSAFSGESGATMAELAIMLPLLVFMALGTLEIGLAVNARAALVRTAVDTVHIGAGMPAGRLDTWSPASGDAILAPDYAGRRLETLSATWAVVLDEFTQGGGYRKIASADGASACPLPPQPDLSPLNLVSNERVAVLRACIDYPSFFGGQIFGSHYMSTVQILPMHRPIPVSCRELHQLGETRDGIFTVDPDANGPVAPFDVLCDMQNGGWTLIAAQFEATAETDWNAGHGANFDPTLTTGQSFALSSAEIPDHSETAFGLNQNAASIVAFELDYDTDDINRAGIPGNDGLSYDIHRSTTLNYPDLDPESGPLGAATPENADCLIVDRTGVEGFDWWFCPNAAATIERGAAFGGADRRGSSDPLAWTIWVR